MGPPSKCLYETLGVSQTATDGEIKKAYRTLALERHPDKNPHDRVKAEEEFKELQHAYNVLSDPHERAWYDGHREDILRGWDGSTEEKGAAGKKARTAKASKINLYAYFTSSAYDGYSGARGFFSVFADMFDRLAREDDDAAEKNPDCDYQKTFPPFGGEDADWSTVREFYNVWEAFSSRQTFAYVDKWNVADVPRGYRREMERENRRERVKERKRFNALVRELISFVKKRDLRVLNRRKEEERLREQEEARKEAQRKKEQEEREKNLEFVRAIRDQALEEDAEELDNILANIALDERIERRQRKNRKRQSNAENSDEVAEYDSGEGVEEEDERDNENVNHETFRGMENAISERDEDTADLESQNDDSTESEEDQRPEELYCAACRKPMRTVGQMADHVRSKKHKAAEKRLRREVLAEEAEFLAASNLTGKTNDLGNASDRYSTDRDDMVDESVTSGRKRKNKKRNRQPNTQATILEQQSDEGSGVENGTERIASTAMHDSRVESHAESGNDSRVSGDGDDVGKRVIEDDAGKTDKSGARALSKREKRKLREQRKREPDNGNSGAAPWQCNRCNATFESRTKLMRHVNALGHALHVDSKQQK